MASDQTLVQIRERSHLDLLDLALLVVRHRPRPLALAATAGIAPFAALNAWLLASPAFPRWLWPVLLVFEFPWATAPLTVVLGGLMFGQHPSPGEVFRRLVRGLPTLLLVHLVYRVMRATLILLPLVSGNLFFANPVILLEKTSGLKAVRRSSQLAADRGGELYLFSVIHSAFGLAFALCFWIGTGAAIGTLFHGETTWDQPELLDLGGLRFQLGVWIAIAFFAVARFLIYIDQRIRTEGWELRVRLQAAARALKEADR